MLIKENLLYDIEAAVPALCKGLEQREGGRGMSYLSKLIPVFNKLT